MKHRQKIWTLFHLVSFTTKVNLSLILYLSSSKLSNALEFSFHLGKLVLSRHCLNQDHLPKLAIIGPSRLNIASKFLEKCIYDSIYNKCITKLSFHQHGFKKSSTFTNLQPYLKAIYKCTDTKFGTVSNFYSDFAEAFNKVPHKLLLPKLYAFGIRGKLDRVIEKFLSNRCQFVRFHRVE